MKYFRGISYLKSNFWAFFSAGWVLAFTCARHSSLKLGSISIGGLYSSSEWMRNESMTKENMNRRLKWIRALARRFTTGLKRSRSRNETCGGRPVVKTHDPFAWPEHDGKSPEGQLVWPGGLFIYDQSTRSSQHDG